MLNKPSPPQKPVTNLLLLVDSLIPISCIPQSVPITPMRIQQCVKEICFFAKNNIIATVCPIKTPEHLAQTGNCLFL